MKHLLITAVIILGLVGLTSAQSSGPFAITHYGHFKKMIHMKKIDGVVNLQEAFDVTNVFAVGATAQGTAEITVIDSRVWLDYGADGLGNAKGTVPADEEAVLLVRAQVKEWLVVKVPADMNISEMQVFILAQAESHNININAPFPFLLEGGFYDVDWHVLNGTKAASGGHKQGGIFKKITEHRDQTGGTVIGFYSAASQGVFTHPGESWHLHIVFEKEEKAGHLDAVSVKQGTLLKLPVSLI